MAEKRELWDKLDNEGPRAFNGFKVYKAMPPEDRALLKAYRIYTNNPDAKNMSRNWHTWARKYGWADRAKAYDAHIERLRRKGYEKAIQKEAEKNAHDTEKILYRTNELLTALYEKAMKRLEAEEFSESLRPAEVINIVKLHVEAASKLAPQATSAEPTSGTWTEEDDNEFANEILADINERRAKAGPLEDDFGAEESVSPQD
jgi:hypothetical protein